MVFELRITSKAEEQVRAIMADPARPGLSKQLKKAFGHLSRDPHHPGLQSHPMSAFDEVFHVHVFSSYVQNRTPQAHRILWTYGPKKQQITILAVIPHY